MDNDIAQTGILVLTRADLERLEVTWAEIIDVLDDAFVQKADGRVQNPPKPMVAPRSDAFINAMPAHLGGSDRTGIKWVAGYESNHAKGLPYIHGVLIMTDSDTGRPLALIDGGWVTEKRTAAASGVSMRHVPDDPRVLALVGAGVQGRAHLQIARLCFPELSQIRVYDRNESSSRRLLEAAGELETYVASSAQDAVEGADLVITTVTQPMDPKLNCDRTATNALILPVEYDDAVADTTFNAASFFSVDDLNQYAAVRNSGDHFTHLREPDTDLASVVSGAFPVPAEGRRVIMNMGIATEDVALGGLVLDRAIANGVGTRIDFP